jgi:hypothetical protein
MASIHWLVCATYRKSGVLQPGVLNSELSTYIGARQGIRVESIIRIPVVN